MFEFPASSLQAGDEFTTDQGETWVKAKVVRSADRGRKVVVVGQDGKERIFKSGDLLIVK